MNIVDLTLPIESGMAGIPRIAFYEKHPVRVEAVTVVDEAQRALLQREGVAMLPGAEAVNSMNTVIKMLWTDRAWGTPEFWDRTVYLDPGVGEWIERHDVAAVAMDCFPEKPF